MGRRTSKIVAKAIAAETGGTLCIHEGSRFGKSILHLKEACKGASFKDALEMTGRTAQNDRAEAAKRVRAWLGLLVSS